MNARNVRLLAAALALVALALWLRQRYSAEAVVARALHDLEEAVEAERLLPAAQHLSRSYSDVRGLTYESFLGALADLFSTHDEIDVALTVESVSISGSSAAVEVRFRVEATSAGGRERLIGSLLEPARAALIMRRERGDWLLYRVEELELPSEAAAAPR